MSVVWILVAFVCGFLTKQLGLPPLVGYLAAGFGLNAIGVEMDASISELAEIGLTLMLFTIGLKVDIRSLMRHDIWSVSLSHISLWIILLTPLLLILSVFIGLSIFDLNVETAAMVAFALSFSSTVCVIKILEDNSELKSNFGDLAIGVLIIQDLVAVLFLAVATGKAPTIWAFGLLLLPLMRPVINMIFKQSGHGELVPLLGFVFALGGAELFELVQMKGGLGALAMGMLIAGLPKASELYKSLISFKDIFLIGFFLSIGFAALPTLEMWLIAAAFCLLLPAKFLLFYLVIVALGFRARTAFLSSLLLSNFSEFGLIVAGLSVESGWLSDKWLVIIALATSFSFVISTLLYKTAHTIYGQHKDFFVRFQRDSAKSRSVAKMPDDVEVIIVGMGRVGMGAYKDLYEELGDKVWGVEVDQVRADKFLAEGVNVVFGDADDIEFWEQQNIDSIKLVMLAIPSINEMRNIISQLHLSHYKGKIAALAHYEDERRELISLGADVAFNYYAEVGTGFAEESRPLLYSK